MSIRSDRTIWQRAFEATKFATSSEWWAMQSGTTRDVGDCLWAMERPRHSLALSLRVTRKELN